MSKDVPTAEGRAEVARVVNARVAELRLSTAELARLTGLAVNTVRGVREARGKYNKSTLVVLSAVLGWDPQHLDRVLHGEAHENAITRSSMRTHFAELARRLAETSAQMQDVAGLPENVIRIDGKIDIAIRKIDIIIDYLRSLGGNPVPD